MKKSRYRFWARDPLPSVVDLDDPVRGALRDAPVLIAFAAQSRRNFKKEKIAALTRASAVVRDKLETGWPASADELAEFWSAYDDLAVDAAPSSAQSIRASIAFGEQRFVRSVLSPTGINGFIALGAFAACIALQSFGGAGRDLIDRADSLDAERLSQQVRIQDNTSARDRKQAQVARMRDTLCPEGPCDLDAYPVDAHKRRLARHTPGVGKDEASRLHLELHMANDDYADKVATVNELEAQLQRMTERTEQLASAVGDWHDSSIHVCRAVPGLCPIVPGGGIDPGRRSLAAFSNPAAGPEPIRISAYPVRFASVFAVDDTAHDSESSMATLQKKTSHQEFQKKLQQVRLIVGGIDKYWIPMFMGLLGAMTFILRSLTIQLREFAYVPRSMSISVIRICLGAVAGVFGALLAPTTEGALKGLPPLFIPFVFGYGIEILFSVMDNVVTSFTQNDNTAARAKIPG